MAADSSPKLIYLVTEDWYFRSHRMPMARAARDAGFEVVVATRVNAAADRQAIEAEGFRVVALDWTRGSRNPVRELMEMAAIAKLYRHEKPDIVHHVAMKPVLEGGIAAWIADVPAIVNALTGLGAVFIGSGLTMRLLRPAIRLILRVALDHPRSRLVMQNQDDLDLMLRKGLVSPDRTVLIPRHEDVLRDHQALSYAGGVIKVPDDMRFKGSDGFERHGDSSIAGMLGYAASRANLPTYGYEPISDLTGDDWLDQVVPEGRSTGRRALW